MCVVVTEAAAFKESYSAAQCQNSWKSLKISESCVSKLVSPDKTSVPQEQISASPTASASSNFASPTASASTSVSSEVTPEAEDSGDTWDSADEREAEYAQEYCDAVFTPVANLGPVVDAAADVWDTKLRA